VLASGPPSAKFYTPWLKPLVPPLVLRKGTEFNLMSGAFTVPDELINKKPTQRFTTRESL